MTEITPCDSNSLTSRRRALLKLASFGCISAILPVIVGGCNSDMTDPTPKATFAFDSDRGALNLAYAYAQFMTDFYARVTNNSPAGSYVGMTTNESNQLTNICNIKRTQRNTLQNLITSGRITDIVLFNFQTLDFSSRSKVMGFAQTFEDLGVAALDGAASSVRDPANLTLLGKIKSVWARHAALIADLNDLAEGSPRKNFLGTADSQGLGPATATSVVVSQLQPYFLTALSASNAA